MKRSCALGLFAVVLVALARCGTSSTTVAQTATAEFGQQAGDLVSSLDDMATGASGAFARADGGSRAACSAVALGSCASNVRLFTFADCTVGTGTFSGTLSYTFGDLATDSVCQMTLAGHYVTRDPSYTVTGLHGGTYVVSKQGAVGQKITKLAAADTYEYTSDGTRRTFTRGSGALTFDYTTSTGTAITVTGASRATRVATGGTFVVADNVSGLSCTLTPASLTWAATCSCPLSGSISGTCTDSSSASVTFTGCGIATATVAGATETVTLHRCYAI